MYTKQYYANKIANATMLHELQNAIATAVSYSSEAMQRYVIKQALSNLTVQMLNAATDAANNYYTAAQLKKATSNYAKYNVTLAANNKQTTATAHWDANVQNICAYYN